MKITPHARERMAQMAVTSDSVHQAVRSPEISYPTRHRSRHPRSTYVRGELAVVVEHLPPPKADRVVTVLWHMAEGRDRASA